MGNRVDRMNAQTHELQIAPSIGRVDPGDVDERTSRKGRELLQANVFKITVYFE